MKNSLINKLILVNLVFFGVLLVAIFQNWHQYLIINNGFGIVYLILILTLVGFADFIRNVHKNHQNYNFSKNIAESCVILGLIGTIVGFIIALGSIEFLSDIDSLVLVVQEMMMGMSVAMSTTLAGAIGSLFLQMNIAVAERENDE